LYLYRGLSAAPSAGAITVTFDISVSGFSWSVVEFSGVSTSGSNGSGALGTPAQATGSDASTEMAVGLVAFTDSNNRPYACWWVNDTAAGSVTPETGYAELHE